MKRLAEKLTQARRAKGYETEQLSLIAGVTSGSIERYEHGRAVPRADVLRRLASALGVTAAYLMTDEADSIDYERALEERVAIARSILGSKGASGAEKLLRKNLAYFSEVSMQDVQRERFMDALLSSYMSEARRAS